MYSNDLEEAYDNKAVVVGKDAGDFVVGVLTSYATTDGLYVRMDGYYLRGGRTGEPATEVCFDGDDIREPKRRERLLYDLLVARNSQ